MNSVRTEMRCFLLLDTVKCKCSQVKDLLELLHICTNRTFHLKIPKAEHPNRTGTSEGRTFKSFWSYARDSVQFLPNSSNCMFWQPIKQKSGLIQGIQVSVFCKLCIDCMSSCPQHLNMLSIYRNNSHVLLSGIQPTDFMFEAVVVLPCGTYNMYQRCEIYLTPWLGLSIKRWGNCTRQPNHR